MPELLDEVTKTLEKVTLRNGRHHTDEEEEVIEGLRSDGNETLRGHEEEEEGHYISKGPIRNSSGGGNNGQQQAKPYMRPHGGSLDGGLDDLLMMGQFLDEISRENAIKQEENGIPGLPNKVNGTNSSLMNCLEDCFGSPDSGSRIVVHDVRGDSGVQVLPTSLSIVIDENKKRIGLNIPRQILPTCVIPEGTVEQGGKLDAYLQLDPNMMRVIKISANIERSLIKNKECWLLRSQFLHLQPFLGDPAISILLEGVSKEDMDEAAMLVQSKSTDELLKTYGPNEDSTLMVLCSQKPTEKLRAQIFYVVKKLLAHPDPIVRRNVVRKNKVGSSALDFACLTNKPRVTRFLVELFYDMGEDLFCPDSSGNTILHVLARKGDEVAATLQALLSLNFHGSRKVYPSNVRNKKQELPIHIAAKSQRCQHRVIQLLHQDFPSCLALAGDEGNLALHYACQFSKDHALLAALLFHNKTIINARRDDGFTGLHLVVARSDIHEPRSKMFPLEEEHQVQMLKVLLDHGADKNLLVEDHYTPLDLHTANRKRVLDLLSSNGMANKQGQVQATPSPAASSGYEGEFVMSPSAIPRDCGSGTPPGLGEHPSPMGNGSLSSGHGSDSEENNEIVPQLVEVLSQHPAIQAVMDGEDNMFQDLLNQ